MTSATELPATPRSVLGVDGCKGGWVGALVTQHGELEWRYRPIERTEELLGAAEVVAIDLPIGLPERGRRRCDELARQRLRGARSSVFFVPSREVLDLEDYRAACVLAHERGEPAPSKQLWGLRRRIRALDRLLQATNDGQIVECHPEVAFVLLGETVADGSPEPLASKRSAAGVGQRLALLQAAGFPRVDAATLALAPREAAIDDALDALVCAWTARRWQSGSATVLGGEPDGRGLPMQIVA